MTNKIAFSVNEPVEVALKYAEGKLSPSPYSGDEWYYTLTYPEGMAMYLPGEVSAKLHTLEIRPNEKFWICKRKPAGQKRVNWDVWRGEAKGPVERRLDAEGERSQLTRDLGRSIDRVTTDRANGKSAHGELAIPINGGADRPLPTPPPHAEPASIVPNKPAQASTQAQPTPKTIEESAVLTAIRAFHAGQEYARSLGFGVTFTSEDIRALAITLVINAADRQKRGAA